MWRLHAVSQKRMPKPPLICRQSIANQQNRYQMLWPRLRERWSGCHMAYTTSRVQPLTAMVCLVFGRLRTPRLQYCPIQSAGLEWQISMPGDLVISGDCLVM